MGKPTVATAHVRSTARPAPVERLLQGFPRALAILLVLGPGLHQDAARASPARDPAERLGALLREVPQHAHPADDLDRMRTQFETTPVRYGDHVVTIFVGPDRRQPVGVVGGHHLASLAIPDHDALQLQPHPPREDLTGVAHGDRQPKRLLPVETGGSIVIETDGHDGDVRLTGPKEVPEGQLRHPAVLVQGVGRDPVGVGGQRERGAGYVQRTVGAVDRVGRAPGGAPREVERDRDEQRAENTKEGLSLAPIRRVARRLSREPLGAKIAVELLLTLFAGLLYVGHRRLLGLSLRCRNGVCATAVILGTIGIPVGWEGALGLRQRLHVGRDLLRRRRLGPASTAGTMRRAP